MCTEVSDLGYVKGTHRLTGWQPVCWTSLGDADMQQCGSLSAGNQRGTKISSVQLRVTRLTLSFGEGGSHSTDRQSKGLTLHDRALECSRGGARLAAERWLQVGEGTCYAAWPVGSTPLHIAAAKGALQLIRAMLQAQVRSPSCVLLHGAHCSTACCGTGVSAWPCAA